MIIGRVFDTGSRRTSMRVCALTCGCEDESRPQSGSDLLVGRGRCRGSDSACCLSCVRGHGGWLAGRDWNRGRTFSSFSSWAVTVTLRISVICQRDIAGVLHDSINMVSARMFLRAVCAG